MMDESTTIDEELQAAEPERRKCGRVDCEALALYAPILVLRATQRSEPATAEIGIVVCGDHRRSTQLSDLVTPVAWQGILNAFASRGWRKPRKSLTRIRWASIMTELDQRAWALYLEDVDVEERPGITTWGDLPEEVRISYLRQARS